MTEYEAGLVLNHRISRYDHADDINEALEVAKVALEKQIPKKVNNRALIALSFPAYMRGDCPVFGSRYLTSKDTNYCNACGQKLDFGEITEEEADKLLKMVN